ncbi:Fungal transcriptional regulatory protein [Penicillium brevicompactum]
MYEHRQAMRRAKNQNNEALQIQCCSKVRALVTTVPLPLASACQIDLNQNELWYLDFYHNRTAVRFSQYFQNSFWQGLLFQMCENHPAIRHASIAMSAWHTQMEPVPFKKDRGPSLALQHSTKAIACLRESLAREDPCNSNRTHQQVVLVTCLTFTLLTIFQGDLYSARRHLVSGYKLLKVWDDQRDTDAIGLAIRQAFSQMHVYWSFCSYTALFVENSEQLNSGYRTFPNTTVPLSKITPPSGADQMDLVQNFSTVVSGLILDYSTCGFDIGPASSIGRGAALVLTKLRLCKSHLLAVLAELNGLAPEDCDSLMVFSLLIDAIGIKLAVARSQPPNEMVYDDHLDQFQNITKIARTLADSTTGFSDITISPFSYRYSVLPTLLWSAAKCRDWQVRRDIFYIMDKRPEDDYWASATIVALKKLIDIESTGVKPGDIIPKSARAYWVNVKMQSEGSKVELRYRRPPYESHLKHGSYE